MTAADDLHRRQSSRRHRRDVLGYKDLTFEDIEHLAPCLMPMPPAEEPVIKQMIKDLPSHLRSLVPIATTGCKVHKRLNVLPIDDLLGAIQHEVSSRALKTWEPVRDKETIALLEDTHAIWMTPTAFHQTFGRYAHARWTSSYKECTACRVCQIAQSSTALIALGACMIARIDPRNWKKSKRIYFLEQWLSARASWDSNGQDYQRQMWEQATTLKNIVCAANAATTPKADPRAYIDDFRAQVVSRSSSIRTARSARTVTPVTPSPVSQRFAPFARATPHTPRPGSPDSWETDSTKVSSTTLQYDTKQYHADTARDDDGDITPTRTPRASRARPCRPSFRRENDDMADSLSQSLISLTTIPADEGRNPAGRNPFASEYAEDRDVAEDPFDDNGNYPTPGTSILFSEDDPSTPYRHVSARPEDLGLGRPKKMPIPSSVYSRPTSAVTSMDETEFLDFYADGTAKVSRRHRE